MSTEWRYVHHTICLHCSILACATSLLFPPPSPMETLFSFSINFISELWHPQIPAAYVCLSKRYKESQCLCLIIFYPILQTHQSDSELHAMRPSREVASYIRYISLGVIYLQSRQCSSKYLKYHLWARGVRSGLYSIQIWI